jgi:beta-phosphoglucomutase-like phosphatase (HAD superfamily)
MKPLSLVAFDMDGVIFDSMPVLTGLACALLTKSYNLSLNQANESYGRTSGIPFAAQLEVLFPGDRRNELVAMHYEHQHSQIYWKMGFPFGVTSLFKTLKEKRILTALVTSTDETILQNCVPQIAQLGFDFIGGNRKNYDKTAQLTRAHILLGMQPEDMLFVSDSWQDEARSIQLGADFRLVTCANVVDQVMRRVNGPLATV